MTAPLIDDRLARLGRGLRRPAETDIGRPVTITTGRHATTGRLVSLEGWWATVATGGRLRTVPRSHVLLAPTGPQ